MEVEDVVCGYGSSGVGVAVGKKENILEKYTLKKKKFFFSVHLRSFQIPCCLFGSNIIVTEA